MMEIFTGAGMMSMFAIGYYLGYRGGKFEGVLEGLGYTKQSEFKK